MMLNVDELFDRYAGVAYLWPDDANYPATIAYFETSDKLPTNKVNAETYPIDPRTDFQGSWDDIKVAYSADVEHAKNAEVTLKVIGDEISIHATTDIGGIVIAVVNGAAKANKSKIKSKMLSWSEFKNYVASNTKTGYVFRGQQRPWPLQTSFHRRGRYRISEFIANDVRQLHRKLSSITPHYFNLSDPAQNGSFFNLLQHHGYPTPLLDWSYSPYVAAFFAFKDKQVINDSTAVVRIYIFNKQADN